MIKVYLEHKDDEHLFLTYHWHIKDDEEALDVLENYFPTIDFESELDEGVVIFNYDDIGEFWYCILNVKESDML